MKQISLFALLFVFVFTAVAAPAPAFADRDDDDDKYEYRYDDDDRDDDDDSDDDDDWRDDFEVEADIYTDITIVKVEKYGKKTTYETDADTRAEIIDFVAAKYGIDEDDIDAVLELDFEDRASRTNERAKISKKDNRPVKVCTDDSNELEVEADVFTDTTVVKVELESGKKYVFESDATTSAAIVEVVADKYDLDEDAVEAALDLEVEDRASRSDDFRISSSSNDDDCDDKKVDNSNNQNPNRDAEIKARIAELQKLIDTLIKLLNLRLSLGN